MVSGGYLNFWRYRPSTLRKSGIPDSVDTPAPPKNTMLSLLSVNSFSLRMVSSILSLHFFCKEHTL